MASASSLVMGESEKTRVVRRAKSASITEIAQWLIQMGIEKKKIHVIPNGVRVVRTALSARRIGSPKVGWVARFSPEKNPEMMIRVARRVTEQIQNVRFCMVGSGASRAVGIAALARELCVDGIVDIEDHREEVEKLYDEVDVVVLTSVTEGLPMVLLEGLDR